MENLVPKNKEVMVFINLVGKPNRSRTLLQILGGLCHMPFLGQEEQPLLVLVAQCFASEPLLYVRSIHCRKSVSSVKNQSGTD
jgi:hypothetical protein